tara:strand:- start:278 stop:451 length:174 start_codon:yes stop_codon:yes gene_type:complete
MQKADKIIRAEENQVSRLLGQGYNFCPKDVWKTQVRDSKPEPPKKKAKNNKKKKSVD